MNWKPFLGRRPFARGLMPAVLLLAAAMFAAAQPGSAAQRSIDPLTVEGPVAAEFQLMGAGQLPGFVAEALDLALVRDQDSERDQLGLAPRFAVPQAVALTPENAGVWEDLPGPFSIWRYRIEAPGALTLNFGFSEFRLPKGSRLSIYPADLVDPADPRGLRVFTERDNEPHGELWTPVVVSDEVVLELVVADESRRDYALTLSSVNRGYRFFGEEIADQLRDKSGTCNIDVVCPEGDDWRAEIGAVGVISTGGSTFCTGFMVNNTAQNARPYFMTANHCGVNAGNAPSLVVYWNFQSPVCGQQGGGSLADFQTGSFWLAGNSTSDFTLVEMDDPVDSAFNVSFAGWDNTSANPVQAVAIHHPSTDEKSISFEFDPTTTTSYLGTAVPGDGTHVRVTDWDLGTTEPGSSGSPLFDQNHHVVGQLHGGSAACGNDLSDWYGRFSVSWPYLAPYLDPSGSGAPSLDTLAPWQSGLQVTGAALWTILGEQGGPFTPPAQDYTLENLSDIPMQYSVGADVPWLEVLGGTGSIPAGGTVTVTVALTPPVFLLPQGVFDAVITFLNLENGSGDTTRSVRLQVGVPGLAHSFTMNADPGWTRGLGWEFGIPQGLGGEHGFTDPVSGHTDGNVIGFNLAGDYPNYMAPAHLITTAIDCSDLSAVSVKFWRWLGVEQPAYDHASFSVSNDGVNFTTVWQNGSEITDGAWTQVAYDISAVADGRATVYLAWTMGSTDGSWTYCGWNIDDVEIWGLQEGGGLNLTMTPFGAPIEIPAGGGRFDYEIRLESSAPVVIDAVIDAVLPNGVVRRILTPPTLSLQAGAHVWNLHQDVPDFAPPGTYTYRCRVVTGEGETASVSFPFVKLTVGKGAEAVGDWLLAGWDGQGEPGGLPRGYALRGAAPNPFNPITTISFDLPRSVGIDLRVFDVAGRLVRTLAAGQVMPAGTSTVIWDGRDEGGRQAATGVYFFRLRAEGFTDTGRMMLVK